MLNIQRPGGGIKDHTLLANIGAKTHAQLDAHLAGDYVSQHGDPDTCWCYNSVNQSLPSSSVFSIINLDTENTDTNNLHYTSAANLTGTVTKAAGSPAIVGVGTLFTTELSVGQVITIPGTAVEKFVVIAITDNTHLTLNRNAANSAGAQTAKRENSAIVIRTTGIYITGAICRFASNATSYRQAAIVRNNHVGPDGVIMINSKVMPVNGDSTDWSFGGAPVSLNQWDTLELCALQISGGALNVESVPIGEPSLWFYRIG